MDFKLLQKAIIMDKQDSGGGGDLPYVEVDYLQTDGEAYMDTGISNTGLPRIVYNFNPVDGIAAPQFMLFGGRGDYGSALAVLYKGRSSYVGAYGYSFVHNLTTSSAEGSWIQVELTPTKLRVNDDEIAITTSRDPSISSDIYLEELHYRTGIDGRNVQGKVGRATIYKDDVVVFDGIPCMLKATGEYGRWDLVSNTFKGNKGTGSYTI